MGIINIDDPEYVKLYRKYDSGLAIRFYHKVFKYRFAVPIYKYLPFDATIMDVGCARGKFLHDMKRFGYRNLNGLDLAFTDTAVSPGEGATFFQASITGADFQLSKDMVVEGNRDNPDLVFDAVFIQNMLHHLPIDELMHTARNVASLCKEGGYVFLYDVNRLTLVGRFFYEVFLRLFPDYYAAAVRETPEQLAFCRIWPEFYSALEQAGLRCIKRSEWSFYKALVFRKDGGVKTSV